MLSIKIQLKQNSFIWGKEKGKRERLRGRGREGRGDEKKGE